MTLRWSGAAMLLAASLPVAAVAQADPVVGCYDIDVGPWQVPGGQERGPDSLHVAAPLRIVLDSVPGDFRRIRDEFHARPAPGSPPSIHNFYSWVPIGKDSIRLRFAQPFTGMEFRLARGNVELRGSAHPSWDVVPPPGREPQWAPAVARRVSCAAPIPEEWKDYRRFVREVRLDDGSVLRIGRPLPDDLDDTDVASWERPVGLFAGSHVDGVVVARDSIRGIRLRYPEGTPVDSLIRHFTGIHGEPVRESEASASWHGRDSVFRIVHRRWRRGDEPWQEAIEIRLSAP